MYRKRCSLFMALFANLAAPQTQAEENSTLSNWNDEAELSFVQTEGNSEVKTLSAKNLLKYQLTDRASVSWKLAALRGEAAGVLTAERYLTELRGDYKITDRSYAFATTGWESDEFAGISDSASIGSGVGYKFLTGPVHQLIGEIGLVYVAERYTDNTENDRVDGRMFGSYIFSFTDKNKATQSLKYLYDFSDPDNYRLHSETALVTALAGVFSIKISYTVYFDHQPIPSTLNETDTILAMALLANF